MYKKILGMSHLLCLSLMTFCVVAFPQVTAESVKNSSDRCLNLLLPAIFPMMVLTDQLSNRIDIKNDSAACILSRITGIKRELLTLFLIGCLCGYPLPAALCAEKYRRGEITGKQAEFICAASNGASPAFLITFAGMGLYNSIFAGILLYISQISASAICAHFFRCPDGSKSCLQKPRVSLSESIKKAAKSFACLSGFVIFFSLAADLVSTIAQFAGISQKIARICACVFDATAIVTACAGLSFPIREIILCTVCATGGISVFFQIRSVFSDSRISLYFFLLFRVATGLVMAIIFLLLMRIFAFYLYIDL